METASVIEEGGCQTVRLPKSVHLAGAKVFVRVEGENIVLEPVRNGKWPAGFFEEIYIADPEFTRLPQGTLSPIK
jgi:virulence-associated protein VagC